MYFFLLFLSLLLVSSISKQYDIKQSEICVRLSAAAYCEEYTYPTMKFDGPASEFILTDTIYSYKTDMLGFVGIIHKLKTIYVSFRGSSSLMNWMDDFEIKKVPYTTFLPECNKCMVHNGFFITALSVRNQTVDSIKRLKRSYPKYEIICTGHSLGASIAQLISMELNRLNYNSRVYNYGQPRVGDIRFSEFVNKKIEGFWRFSHNRDIVVHIPIGSLQYYHSCGEVFEDEYGNLGICSDIDCEDIHCAEKFSLQQTNSQDHMIYLKYPMDCL
jgi:hypothetical protein